MTAIGTVGSLSQLVPLVGNAFESASRRIVDRQLRVPNAFRLVGSIPIGVLFFVHFALDPPSYCDEWSRGLRLGVQATAVSSSARLRLE